MTSGLTTQTTEWSAVADTALWTAAARARESARTDRLFDDPFASLLAGEKGRDLLHHFHTARASSDGNPVLPIRTRWFDDFILAAQGSEPCQVVALGGGLDTRAFRLNWPADTVFFDVDQGTLLSYKSSRLGTSDGTDARCEYRQVQVNLADDWTSALTAAGYEPERRSVWFGEGLLFYLPEALARDVLSRAARLSTRGSRLAVDLIGTGIFRLPYMSVFLNRLAEAGSPWVFGTDEPSRFVTETGWNVVEITEPGRDGADYGRWPGGAEPLALRDLPRSHFVTAEITELFQSGH
jgi:methyltransferase (TIGR00027 family)